MADENTNIIVWWIDDDHIAPQSPRDAEAKSFSEQASGKLQIVPIHPARFEQSVTEAGLNLHPDLLLIDLRLNNHKDPGLDTSFFAQDGVRLRGSIDGVASLHDVPKYLVSGIITDVQSGADDEGFEWVMSHASLTELGGAFLHSDSVDYLNIGEAIRSAAGDDSDDKAPLVDRLSPLVGGLIRPPKVCSESLSELLKHLIIAMLRSESHYKDGSNRLPPSRRLVIGRWIRSVLQKHRGPLVDDLAAATVIGAKVDYFIEAIKPTMMGHVEELCYRGVFSGTGKMTLWKESVRDWALALGDDIKLSSATEFAKTIAKHLNVPLDQQATCAVCGKLWPEGIAFDEEDPDVEEAVHWRCSSEAADVDLPFGFDVQRSFVAE